MKKRSIHTILAISLVTGMILLTSGCSSAQPVGGQDTTPNVKVIKLSAVGSGLMASGKVEAEQEVQIASAAKLPVKVAQVLVSEGTKVKAGQELVKLETDDFVQAIKQAEAGVQGAQARLADMRAGTRGQEIEAASHGVEADQANVSKAKATLDNAQKNYDRDMALFKVGALSQQAMDSTKLTLETAKKDYEKSKSTLEADQAQLSLKKAGQTADAIKQQQAAVSAAQAAYESARNALADATIKAPVDGIIVGRNIEPGEMANPSVPLMTLVKMDNVKIQVSVPQEQINQVKKGSKVNVRVNGLDKTFTGTVEFVSPVSDANNNTFPVKVKVANEEGLLRAGMLAEVSFNMGNKGIEIPSSALIKKDNKTYVFTFDGNAVHLVEVETEVKNKDWVYSKNGIHLNDQIVINPSENLKDGAKVKVD